MMVMWRTGLRVSEAADLQIGDCRLKDRNPVLRVRRGKGRRSRLVPVHDELAQALQVAIDFAPARAGARRSAKTRLFDVTRRTVGRWIEITVDRAVEAGALDADRQISPHTFRHSFARHVLANGVPINVLSRWLGTPLGRDDVRLPGAPSGPQGLDEGRGMTEAAWDLFIKALPHALFTVGLVALFKLDRLNAEWWTELCPARRTRQVRRQPFPSVCSEKKEGGVP